MCWTCGFLLPLKRPVNMLGYQFLAMASEAEVEEKPSEQYYYPEQKAVNVPPHPLPFSRVPIRGLSACFIGSIQGQQSSSYTRIGRSFRKAQNVVCCRP